MKESCEENETHMLVKEVKETEEEAVAAKVQHKSSAHTETGAESITLAKMDQLAAAKYKAGKFKDAADTLYIAVEMRSKSLGAEDLRTVATMNNLAAALGRLHMFQEAEKLLRVIVQVREKKLGLSHTDTLISVNHLGVVLKQQHRLSEAEIFLMRACQGFEETIGATDILCAESYYNLATLLVQKGNRLLAHEYFRKAHVGLSATLGPNHEHTLDSLHWEIKCNLASKSYNNIDLETNNSYNTEHNHHVVNLEQYRSQFDWNNSPSCNICSTVYTLFNREHHCRICSRSVCYTCWGKLSLVLEYSTTDPVKICKVCAQQGF